jgi:hypothetical protein
VDADLQAKIFEGERQRVLITATDEFVITRSMSPETWAALSGMLTKAAADRILHARRAIRRSRGDHGDAEDTAGVP